MTEKKRHGTDATKAENEKTEFIIDDGYLPKAVKRDDVPSVLERLKEKGVKNPIGNSAGQVLDDPDELIRPSEAQTQPPSK